MNEERGPVLITGCSSGIGAATAAHLLERGHIVYATARRPACLDGLRAAGAHTLALDVTDEQSMKEAVEAVVGRHGRVGALVNNAGYATYGAVEELSVDEARAQFETNVLGPTRLTQLVLPSMRAHGGGTVVNVSSMAGRFASPFGGHYSATKYALEALSDALRFEVAPFGVDVVVVEPGLVRTGFGGHVEESLRRAPVAGGPYAERAATVRDSMSASWARPAMSAPPESVAAVIGRALEARRPRTRYVTSFSTRLLLGLRAVTPDRLWDRVVGATVGL